MGLCASKNDQQASRPAPSKAQARQTQQVKPHPPVTSNSKLSKPSKASKSTKSKSNKDKKPANTKTSASTSKEKLPPREAARLAAEKRQTEKLQQETKGALGKKLAEQRTTK